METFTFQLTIGVTGTDFNEQELKDFVRFQLGLGSVSLNNPFISEDETAEITDVDLE